MDLSQEVIEWNPVEQTGPDSDQDTSTGGGVITYWEEEPNSSSSPTFGEDPIEAIEANLQDHQHLCS